MIKKILVVLYCCFFSVDVFAEAEEQFGTYFRTWNTEGYRYGLPGLANIKVNNKDGIKYYEDVLPEGDGKLIIDLEHFVEYGGSTYAHLTIASKGRIFLGDYKDYILPDDGDDGIYPYVKAISNVFKPIAGSNSIPVSWRQFNEHNDVFTVVEIGPYLINGLNDQMVCQVSFYNDGEIQVQYWNKSRSGIASKITPITITSFPERPFVQLPFVYNGNNRINLRDGAVQSVYSPSPISIYEKTNGNEYYLREGWIAKSFEDEGALFQESKGEDSKLILDVDFGLYKSSGGLLAYDYARENPIVGSFQNIQVNVVSEEREEGFSCINCSNGDVPVYFWYFNEVYEKSHLAGYPYLASGSSFYLDYNAISAGVNQKCLSTSSSITTIYPCAYGYSWRNHKGDVDTIIAPAIKMQTADDAHNRKIHIKFIRVRPLQPRAIQFQPPSTKKIIYEGNGGYMEIGGKKAPVAMVANASVHAIIHVTPGFKISQIMVNGKLAFDVADKSVQQPAFSVKNMPDQNMAYLDFNLVNDVKIAVTYELCSEREVSKYDPSLANIIPSYKKIEIFNDPANRTNVLESYAVNDGFDETVQTQVAVKPGHYLISSIYKDEMGKTLFAPMAYISEKTSYSFEQMYCQQCVRNSAAYYNGQTDVSKERVDSYGYPYSQQNYHYGENKAIVNTSAGVGEASFELSNDFAKTWKIPVKSDKSSEFFKLAQLREKIDPNAIGSVFDNEYLNKLAKITEASLSEDSDADYPYELTVNLSYDGIYTQYITDVAGNVMASWSMHDGDAVVTRNEYYGYDGEKTTGKTSLLKRSFVENHENFETTYEYDDFGRIVSTTYPDRGRTETKYDAQNRIRFTRDQKQINKGDGYFNILVYDENDRVVMEGNVRGDCADCSFSTPDKDIPLTVIYPVHESIYGKPSAQELHKKASNIDESLLADVVKRIEGVSIRDIGASISYNDEKKVNTIKMSSYDRLGRVVKNWIVYNVESGAPSIEISYAYKLSGEIDTTTISQWNPQNKSWDVVAKRNRVYDNQGRLEKIYELDVDNKNKPLLLASFEHNSAGVEVKSTYYDKGSDDRLNDNVVFLKEYNYDIYGRITQIGYKDANGRILYEEKLEYNRPIINRSSKNTHTWNDLSGKKMAEIDEYSYDDLGRLQNFVTSGSVYKKGSYSYDMFGRLTEKTEGDSVLLFEYQDGSYQPKSLDFNKSLMNSALLYDPNGRVWMDGFKKFAYKLNSLGMPERIARYNMIPSGFSLDDFEKGVIFDEEMSMVEMAYDETGTRIWERETNRSSKSWSRLTVPGIGLYKRESGSGFVLEKLDLVDGGYRTGGVDGLALFPMTDAQGNVRGYASKGGVKSTYTYYPFGQVTELENSSDDVIGKHRWQGKEYDGMQGEYYFGARYFDPLYGLWMSPDPAKQFANPYSYGGDPVNFIDPSGMFAFGVGFVYGWDQSHGWQFGLGAAGDFSYSGSSHGSSFNLSYTWNQDGSGSFNIGGSGQWQWWMFNFNAGLGFSYNSYTGSVLSTQGGACVGNTEVACAGVENGYGLYWDASGSFMGVTAYLETYAEAAGGLSRVSSGYEWGLFGAEARGGYAGATLAGIHAEISQNGGASWGFEEGVYYGVGDTYGDGAANGEQKKVHQELWIPSLGRFGHFRLGENYDTSKPGLREALQNDLLALLKPYVDLNEPEAERFYKDILKRNSPDMSQGQMNSLMNYLVSKGCQSMVLTWPFDWSFTTDKRVLWAENQNGYPHIEYKYNQNGAGSAYSSYNYGSNLISHLFIDYFGYYIPRWLYGVND